MDDQIHLYHVHYTEARVNDYAKPKVTPLILYPSQLNAAFHVLKQHLTFTGALITGIRDCGPWSKDAAKISVVIESMAQDCVVLTDYPASISLN